MGFYKNIGFDLKVNMTRTIHPVGQGAFYSEVFSNNGKYKYVVVYDCGGTSNRTNECVTRFRDEQLGDTQIDALFISHFHCDHINGISQLIENKCIKKIFIPAITPSIFFVDLLYNLSKGDYGFYANEFLLDKILPALDINSNEEKKDPIVEVVSNKENKCIEVEGEGKCLVWKYEVINCCEENADKNIELFLTEIKDIIGKDFSFNNFLKKGEYNKIISKIIVNNQIKLLEQKFKNHFKGNQNKYSLLVHSRKSDNAVIGNEAERVFSNCLYTGDIPISDEVRRIIKSLDVNMIQVPHHGSEHNFNIDIYHRHEIAFISVGDVNPYNHPSKMVVDQIAGYCSRCRIITELSKELKYQFNILPEYL